MIYSAVLVFCLLHVMLGDVDALTREEKRASKQLKRCYFQQKYPCLYSEEQAGKVICLDRHLLCDGEAHCPREDDEHNCDQRKHLTNVALGKPTLMSSVDSNARSPDAITDGDMCMSNVFASSQRTPNPWAMINLEADYDIQSVTFEPHYSFPAPNLSIEAGNDKDHMTLCYNYPDKIVKQMKFEMVNKCQGRFIRFSVDSAEPVYFTIVEAEVYSLV